MADYRCRKRRRELPMTTLLYGAAAPMEEDTMHMNRYIAPRCACTGQGPSRGWAEERALLEQMVELASGQNQLLVDLLGAVNALTAALLAAQVRV
ncbi:MAG: hypothetical protein RR216_03195 [Pseudoflavonifractor sp.]